MRNDFLFMKEIASYTHVGATNRYERLQEFVTDIHTYILTDICWVFVLIRFIHCRNPECQEELAKWNMKIDTDLVKFEARILDAEYILYHDVNILFF